MAKLKKEKDNYRKFLYSLNPDLLKIKGETLKYGILKNLQLKKQSFSSHEKKYFTLHEKVEHIKAHNNSLKSSFIKSPNKSNKKTIFIK